MLYLAMSLLMLVLGAPEAAAVAFPHRRILSGKNSNGKRAKGGQAQERSLNEECGLIDVLGAERAAVSVFHLVDEDDMEQVLAGVEELFEENGDFIVKIPSGDSVATGWDAIYHVYVSLSARPFTQHMTQISYTDCNLGEDGMTAHVHFKYSTTYQQAEGQPFAYGVGYADTWLHNGDGQWLVSRFEVTRSNTFDLGEPL